MGLIPDDVIERVRLSSDIVEVISRQVRLTRKGRNYVGLCPFHADRQPSFTVTPDKQIFHCFGCNKGGDVFKYLMLKENITFVEAVKQLARQNGISLPVTESRQDLERYQKLDGLRQIHNLARDFYHRILVEHRGAAKAREYLAARGISREVQEYFQIGYAPVGWDHLLGFMSKHRIPPRILAEAGLAQERESGGYYDRFRDRVIFPIWDVAGRVVAFGGRVLGDGFPKYLNSPETALFVKGHNLYGLHLAGKKAREKGYIAIMEGYMDVVTAHSHGISNTVASLGTSLTKEQGNLLLKHSKDVVIAFDADEAGVAAVKRTLEILQDVGCQGRVVSLPEGEDPDDFIRRHGVAAWEDMVSKGDSALDFLLKQEAGRTPPTTISGKLSVLGQVLPYIAKAKTKAEREESLKTLSRFLGLSPEAVVDEFRKFTAQPSRDNRITRERTKVIRLPGTSPTGRDGDSREKAERRMLQMILEEPAQGEEIMRELGSKPFRNEHHNRIFLRTLELSKEEGFQPVKLFDRLAEEDHPFLSRILAAEGFSEATGEKLSDYVAFIRQYDRQERRTALISMMGEAEKQGELELFNSLWNEYALLRSIAEAERTGDNDRANNLLQDYRQRMTGDNLALHDEGSESAERRN